MSSLSYYIHWPYCLSKCPYCDFNSHVRPAPDYALWKAAYSQAIDRHFELFELAGKEAKTVFFGGGTPSLMPPDLVAFVIDKIAQKSGIAQGAEISLEANPTSSEAERFKAYAAAGVTRLSMGVQSLNNKDLRKLGRTHSAEEAKAAFEVAKSVFNSVSFDLIYAREGQTPQAWEQELTEAVALAVDHLSLYQLTIEEGTRFADFYRRGKLTLPPDEAAEEMYFLTARVLESHGYQNYEISNYAKPGAACEHNLTYWRYGEYIGIGPGAHGRVIGKDGIRKATETVKNPEIWLKQTLSAENNAGINVMNSLSTEEQATERALVGLRLAEGVDLLDFPENFFNQEALLEPIAENYFSLENNRLRVTPKGAPVLNYLLARIL